MGGRNTKQRILDISLTLFNEQGEANVTTNHIADELDISPGNLHYHFRRKHHIVDGLYKTYQEELSHLLGQESSKTAELEDLWLYLHLLFETMERFRFLYLDVNDLLLRYPHLVKSFRNLLGRKRQTALSICQDLVEAGIMSADGAELETLADNITVLMVYWLPFTHIAGLSKEDSGQPMARAVYQVISLALPYLREPERSQSRLLALSYLQPED